MSDSVGNVTGLDIPITSSGIEQTRASVVGTLADIADAATTSAAAVDKNTEAYERAIGVSGGLTTAQADLQARVDAVVQSSQELDRTNAGAVAAMQGEITVVQQLAAAMGESAQYADQLAAAEARATQQITDSTRAMTLAQMSAIEMDAARTTSMTRVTDATRSMTLLQLQAIEMDAARAAGTRAAMLAQEQAIAMDIARTGSITAMSRAQEAAIAEDIARSASLRAMTLLQIQAIELDAARTAAMESATVATGVHGLSLGRVNMELGTMVGRLAGANTAVTRFGAMLGGAVGGYGQMILVTAAIVGMVEVYKKLTEETRKAKEEQDAATAALQKWYDTETAGVAADRLRQVAAEQALLTQQKQRLELAQSRLDSPTFNRSEGVNTALEKEKADLQKQIADITKVIAAGQADADKQQSAAFDSEQAHEASILAQRLKFNASDETARQDALAALKRDQALYAQYMTLPDTVENSARVAAYTQTIKTLTDALYPKGQITQPQIVKGADAIIKSLDAQLKEMRLVDEQSNKSLTASADLTAQMGLQGEALELLKNAEKEQDADAAARDKYVGNALTEALATNAQLRAEADARVRAKQASTDQGAALKQLNDLIPQVTKVGEANVKATNEQTTSAAALTAENKRLADSLQSDLLHAVEEFAQRGINSWKSFFSEAEGLSARLTQQFEQDIAKQVTILEKANKEKDADTAAAAALQIERLEQVKKVTTDVAAAIAIASAGYAIGQSTGNSAIGVFGGAASGAASGFEVAGGEGAVVGGLLGAASGLLGAASAQQDAAAKLQQAADAFQKTLTTYTASAEDPITQKLAGIQSAYETLYQQTNALVASGAINNKTGDQQHTSETETMLKLYQQASDDFWASVGQSLNALKGPLGAYQNQLDAVEKTYRDNIASAEALHATQAQLDEIEQVRIQSEKALEAAYEETIKRTQESLQVRQLEAQGMNYQAKQLQFEIAQRQELADAMAQGLDADTIAMIKLTQAMEAQAAAAAQAKLITDTNNALAVRAATAGGDSALAARLQQQIDQANELYDAQQKGLDDATIANIKYVQGLEAVALAAQQAEAAMQASISWIKEQAGVFGDTSAQTVAAEKSAYGFDGLSDADIEALYTKFQAGQTLSPEQQALNSHIASFLSDERAANSAATSSGGGRGVTVGTTNQTVSDAQKLTETTGQSMADYLASINVHVASLDKKTDGGGSPFSIPYSPGGSGSTTVQVTIQNVNVGTTGVDGVALGKNIASSISAQLGPDLTRERLRLSPVRSVR